MSVEFTLFGIDKEINDLLISCNYSEYKVNVSFRNSKYVAVNLLYNNYYVERVFLIKLENDIKRSDLENNILIALINYFSNPSKNA